MLTLTQEKKHELQVLMAEDQPGIVAMPEVSPKRRSYVIEDIKIQGYITFESELCGEAWCGNACSLIN